MKPLLIALIAATVTLPHVSQSQVKATSGPVTIGVRTDAMPFVWQDTRTKSYVGFFYDICTVAVKRAGYMFREEPVDASQRKQFFEGAVTAYNLLCDPTTVTLKRLNDFVEDPSLKHLQFSPIIFVANGSYVRLDHSKKSVETLGYFNVRDDEKRPDNCEEIVSNTWSPPQKEQGEEVAVCSTYAQHPFDGAKFKECFKSLVQLRPVPPDPTRVTQGEIWGYVKGTTIEDQVDAEIRKLWNDGDGKLICKQSLDDHKQAVELFCSGRLARYYGDLDIIRASIAMHRTDFDVCPFTEALEEERTFEPYALVISSSDTHPEFSERFVYALYKMFHDGTIKKIYGVNFPNTPPTTYLRKLFEINKVPLGE